MPARRFELPATSPWRTVGLLVVLIAALSLLGGYWVSESSELADFWTAAALTGLLTGGGPLLFALVGAAREWRKPRFVEVGTDGVLVGARLIRYADISRAEHEQEEHTVRREIQGGAEEEDTYYRWTVAINLGGQPGGGILLGGETVEIVTKDSSTPSEDPLGAEIAQAINEARAAWAAGRRSEKLAESLARRERTGSEWLEALRRLGSGATTSYRRGAVDLERLSRLLENPRGKPSARAAAAIVLTASGDRAATEKLRIAAGGFVDQRVRIALENIADEAAVAEALEALEAIEDADRERRGRRTRS